MTTNLPRVQRPIHWFALKINQLIGVYMKGILDVKGLTHYFIICFSIWVFFHEHSQFTWQQGMGEGYFWNSFLPLSATSQTLRHLQGDYCRELTSTHSCLQADWNRELLGFEPKSVTTKLRDHHLSIYLSLFQPPNDRW